MQMQHLGSGWFGYTWRTWRTLWSRTHFHISGTPFGWIHWNQSSPMCILDGQRLTLTILAGFATHPMPSWGGWWTSTASPGNHCGNFHGIWRQIQKLRTWISWARRHQHPTPIALFTRISEARCSLAEKWHTDIWIDPTTTQSNSNLLETSSENEVIDRRMFETNGLFGTYRMLSN